jgi:predicted metal-dependent hydrolase
MMGNCTEPPREELLLAVRQFNNRDWFECHETLEDLWMGETGEARDLYQGVLQVSVALYHWKNLNFGGAMSLLQSGVDHLSRVQPVCQQVDVLAFMTSANKARESLALLGKDRMTELESSLIPRLQLVK